MQLSPRQYQVDPTGSSYVADTRPLMAAMGAQAATQIEGNRMMQETVQRGMKGVEDFAARRQLAAARAQLGELNINDPDYGQKLSGLVMDNPLAFTNEKTAPVANYAFKQAANDFQSKRENEQRMADAYRSYLYQRDLAGMSSRNQSSGEASRFAQAQANVYRNEAAVVKGSIQKLQTELVDAPPEARPALQQELDAATNELGQLNSSYLDSINAIKQTSAAPMSAAVPSPMSAQSAGNGFELPVGGDDGTSFLETTLLPPVSETGEMLPPETMAPETVAPAGVPPFGSDDLEQMPPPPLVSETPAAAPVTADLAKAQQALSEYRASKAGGAKTVDKMSSAELGDQEKFTDDLSYTDPDILKVTSELDGLKSRADALKTVISNSAIPNADQQAQYLVAVSELTKKQSEVDRAKANFRTAVRFAGGPEKYVAIKLEQEKAAREEALKAQANAPAAPAAPAAEAGTTPETPKPPAPPVSTNPLEQAAIDRELKRKAGPEPVSPEVNKKWTENKQKVIDIISPKELIRIADEVYGDSVLGVSLPADKTRLTKLIQVRLSDNLKISGDEKSGKNLGFYQDGKYVSQEDLVSALVDDIIRARQSGIAKANDSAITPQSRIPLNTNTELIAQ